MYERRGEAWRRSSTSAGPASMVCNLKKTSEAGSHKEYHKLKIKDNIKPEFKHVKKIKIKLEFKYVKKIKIKNKTEFTNKSAPT
jgi:hypothetical protein